MRLEKDLHVETDFFIHYEDGSFLVVDKPSPLPVHPTGRFLEKNLIRVVERKTGLTGLRAVNRLDSETSGLVILAKNQESAGRIGKQFEGRQVIKEYAGLVFGSPPEENGTFSFSLGVEKGPNYYRRIPLEGGEAAVTHYRVLKKGEKYSWVKFSPFTGRTHQIRVHTAAAGHPLVGDKVYNDPEVFSRYVETGWCDTMAETVKLPRLALHAVKLCFRHPDTGREMLFESAVPAALTDFFPL